MYANRLWTKLIIIIIPTIRVVGKSLYFKGHTSWIRSPETSDPGQPLSKSGTSTVSCPQWHVHRKPKWVGDIKQEWACASLSMLS